MTTVVSAFDFAHAKRGGENETSGRLNALKKFSLFGRIFCISSAILYLAVFSVAVFLHVSNVFAVVFFVLDFLKRFFLICLSSVYSVCCNVAVRLAVRATVETRYEVMNGERNCAGEDSGRNTLHGRRELKVERGKLKPHRYCWS